MNYYYNCYKSIEVVTVKINQQKYAMVALGPNVLQVPPGLNVPLVLRVRGQMQCFLGDCLTPTLHFQGTREALSPHQSLFG